MASLLPVNPHGLPPKALSALGTAFNCFAAAEELPDIIAAWHAVLQTLELDPCSEAVTAPGFVFNLLNDRARASQSHRLIEITKALSARMKRPEYADATSRSHCSTHLRALIVGAGPAGLRSALELAMLGVGRVTLVEKRRQFSRHNVLHIWPNTIADLRELGAKTWFHAFCSGGYNHVAIRRLQHLLVKNCLIMGVQLLTGVAVPSDLELMSKQADPRFWSITLVSDGFGRPAGIGPFAAAAAAASTESSSPSAGGSSTTSKSPAAAPPTAASSLSPDSGLMSSIPSPRGRRRRSKQRGDGSSTGSRTGRRMRSSKKQLRVSTNSSFRGGGDSGIDIRYNVLFGADGERSAVPAAAGIERKTFAAGRALGVTCNFAKTTSHIDEFTRAYYLNQAWFKGLEKETGASLENIVHFRDETLYFVFTVKKEGLLASGVLREDRSDSSSLVRRDNIDSDKLAAMCRAIGRYCQLPKDAELVTNHHGRPDAELFDFTRKQAAVWPSAVIERKSNKARLFVSVVGDAQLAPFWPQGTGANRAMHAAQDAAWAVRTFADPAADPKQLLRLHNRAGITMSKTVPEAAKTIHPKDGESMLDPMVRYSENRSSRGSITHSPDPPCPSKAYIVAADL